MNKRVLIGLATAGIIGGGTYGFAATLGVTTADLGAGTSLVASCDNTVDVDYTAEWDAGTERYEVDVVTVSGIAGACDGDDIRVALADGTGLLLGELNIDEMLTGGSQTFDFTTQLISAQAVEQVHVVISGD